MGVTVCTVCVGVWSRDEERSVRGTLKVSTAGEAVTVLSCIEHFILVVHSRVLFNQRGATLPEPNPNLNSNRTMSIDVKYDTSPCDGTPGQP